MIRRSQKHSLRICFLAALTLVGAASGACKDDPKPDPGGAASSAALVPSTPAAELKLPGIDTSALLPRERKEFNSYVTEFLSPCAEVAVPISQCITEKRACGSCLTAAKFLLKAVRSGYPREEIEKIYKHRFDPKEVKILPVDGSPTLGPEGAPITIVEFADFECPFCAMEYPVLEKLVTEDRKDKVRLVYKFKLLGHPHGEIAARAAAAAGLQGKFWEMHHKLFDNQKALEQRDLETYAKAIGLDVPRFVVDMKSKPVSELIEKDHKMSESLGVAKTPTIFVNGREIEPEGLMDYVAEELGESPKPKAMPSASASADASASASAGASAGASASAKPVDAGAAKGK